MPQAPPIRILRALPSRIVFSTLLLPFVALLSLSQYTSDQLTQQFFPDFRRNLIEPLRGPLPSFERL